MSDQVPQTTPTPGAGQPQPDSAQPVTLTQQQLNELLAQTEERAFRRAQSYVDKTSETARKKLTEIEEAWKVQERAGAPVPDDVKSKVRQQVIQEAEAERFAEPAKSGQQPPASGAPPAFDQTLANILTEDAQEAGVYVFENDPEAEMLDFSTPRKAIASHQKALEAKKARLAKVATEQGQPPRLPGAAAGGAPGDLMSQYKQEAAKLRPGSEEMMQLRRKYRQKGLNL